MHSKMTKQDHLFAVEMYYMPFLLTLESKMYAVRADILTELGESEGIGWADNLKTLNWG